MSDLTFQMTDGEYKSLFKQDKTLGHGLTMDDMEGVWLAWETDPKALEAVLPPIFGYVAPIVMCYVMKCGTTFTAAYDEACTIVLASYKGEPAALQTSMLLCGDGAPQAAFLGREMAGMPKKICDDISVTRDGDSAHATIVKDGVTILSCALELGAYNTLGGDQVFTDWADGAVIPSATWLPKFNLEQYEDGHMGFENGRLLKTVAQSFYETWIPATAEITLQSCENAPWGCLPVRTVIAGGYAKYAMRGFRTFKIDDVDAQKLAPYMLRPRYDAALFE